MHAADESRTDIRSFLASRRARLSVEETGLEDYGSRRRVAGLRRDEVARLANISVEYYTRLERGKVRSVSDTVLRGVGDALRLSALEREHLANLVRQRDDSEPPPLPDFGAASDLPAKMVIDAIDGVAAFIRDGLLNVVAANRLARRLYAATGMDRDRPVNLARFIYLDPMSKEFYVDWGDIASQAVGTLRTQAARHPNEPLLRELIDDLSTHSEEFRAQWARHEVKRYDYGTRQFIHPDVDALELVYQACDVRGAADQVLVLYTARPGTPSDRKLRALDTTPEPAR